RGQKNRVATGEGGGLLDAIDAHAGVAFEHDPDDRLVVWHGLFYAFAHANFFQRELGTGRQARYRRKQSSNVTARRIRLSGAREVDAFERLVHMQLPRLAGALLDAI